MCVAYTSPSTNKLSMEMELAKAAQSPPPSSSFLRPMKPPNTPPLPARKYTLNRTSRNKLNLSRQNLRVITEINPEISVPTMSDILDSSRAQNLDLELRTLGPFFRITAKSLKTQRELGRAEGVIRVWFGGGKILHLDSMRLRRETIGMEKSIFGIGLFIGAAAIRHGYECGCDRAELLAINDTPIYHSKLVRFYKRLGFKEVYEVTGSSLRDYSHMLVWGGVGTRMDADLEDLMIKWCARFKPRKPAQD